MPPTAIAPRPPQTLFLALDAVPHAMMAELHARGVFPNYGPPTRVVSTFPSLTEVGFTGLFRPLGAGKADGYEGGHFDAATRRMVTGGQAVHHPGELPGYEYYFDFLRHTQGAFIAMYAAPFFAARRDLAKIAPLIAAHPQQRTFFGYIGSTDSTAHLDGEEKTIRLIRMVANHVEQLRRDYAAAHQQPLEVVLFSDHGFYWGDMRALNDRTFRRDLKRHGLRLTDNLRHDQHVATLFKRNINGVDLYAAPDRVADVAEVLLGRLGTDLVMTPQSDHILVQASHYGDGIKSARIRATANMSRLAYEPVNGDPLNYAPVVGALRAAGLLDENGFAAADDWFAASHAHFYPDAPYRIWDAFHGLVLNPASLLLSTLESWEFGGKVTRAGAALRGGLIGTHGALARDSSSAFVMTTDSSVILPEVARYDQALAPFARP